MRSELQIYANNISKCNTFVENNFKMSTNVKDTEVYMLEVIERVSPVLVHTLGFGCMVAAGQIIFQLPPIFIPLQQERDYLDFWVNVKRKVGLIITQPITIAFIDKEFEFVANFMEPGVNTDPEETMARLANEGIEVKGIHFLGQRDGTVN